MLSRDLLVLTADTDVIIKRGIDTIRICVVPTKTNTKVISLLCLIICAGLQTSQLKCYCNAPINVLPHYGAFDKGIDRQRLFTSWVCQIPTIAPYNPEGGWWENTLIGA